MTAEYHKRAVSCCKMAQTAKNLSQIAKNHAVLSFCMVFLCYVNILYCMDFLLWREGYL